MVKIYVDEQMGNQLFQYATAKKISLLKGTSLGLDITSFGRKRSRYMLDQFQITGVELPSLPHLILKKLKIRRNPSPLYSNLPIISRAHDFDGNVFNSPDSCFLWGLFQSWRYFNDIRNLLKIEIIEKNYIPTNEEVAMQNLIVQDHSVAVHVRRGDYLQHPTLNICTPDYYHLACDYVRSLCPSAKFFIFSNDIDYCRREIRIRNAKYVDLNEVGNRVISDFRLMRSCRHHIIPNSTYSWWAAYLTDNNIVVLPYKWNAENNIPIAEKSLPHWNRLHF